MASLPNFQMNHGDSGILDWTYRIDATNEIQNLWGTKINTDLEWSSQVSIRGPLAPEARYQTTRPAIPYDKAIEKVISK